MSNLYEEVLMDGLGDVQVGDIIAGRIYTAQLKVLDKTAEDDGSYTYRCKYLEGDNVGEIISISSYYQYDKIGGNSNVK